MNPLSGAHTAPATKQCTAFRVVCLTYKVACFAHVTCLLAPLYVLLVCFSHPAWSLAQLHARRTQKSEPPGGQLDKSKTNSCAAVQKPLNAALATPLSPTASMSSSRTCTLQQVSQSGGVGARWHTSKRAPLPRLGIQERWHPSWSCPVQKRSGEVQIRSGFHTYPVKANEENFIAAIVPCLKQSKHVGVHRLLLLNHVHELPADALRVHTQPDWLKHCIT